MRLGRRIGQLLLMLLVLSIVPSSISAALPQLQKGTTISTLDGTVQPYLFWAPENAARQSTPLFVFLHSWSSDYQQDNSKWFSQAVKRGWIYLHPDFRGVNEKPQACGSRFARQDILDAMDVICRKYRVDTSRVYLAGVSGGGHMSMLMAGHYPDRFSAVSSWVGVTSLADWYEFHSRGGKPGRYAVMIQKSLGGIPGTSAAIDADARDRSPVFHLGKIGDLPISIYAGVQDGHTGSVPIRHSLSAFNAIAHAAGAPVISEEEIVQLTEDRKLSRPSDADRRSDPDFEREILLRRQAGNARVTIFDGGHESLPESACRWLTLQRRATPWMTRAD